MLNFGDLSFTAVAYQPKSYYYIYNEYQTKHPFNINYLKCNDSTVSMIIENLVHRPDKLGQVLPRPRYRDSKRKEDRAKINLFNFAGTVSA